MLLTVVLSLFYFSTLSAQGDLLASANPRSNTELGFYINVDDDQGVVSVDIDSATWKTAVIRNRKGKTIHKVYREDIMLDSFKFSMAHINNGYYFCDIRFEGGKKAVKTFQIFP